jgi:hypothetical protein
VLRSKHSQSIQRGETARPCSSIRQSYDENIRVQE